jgi:hypothetical protein
MPAERRNIKVSRYFWKHLQLLAGTKSTHEKYTWKYKMNPGSNPLPYIAAILLLLSGCASAPQHLSAENQQEIKSVAVVSLVPESINFGKIEIISSQNEFAEFDMGSKVADAVYSVSRDRIAQTHPDWIIKTVDYDRAALLAKVKSGSGFGDAQVREAFADLARSNDLDAIFVVRAAADREDDVWREFEERNLREGLNVLLKNDTIGDSDLFIRANLGVTIIGKDGEVMAAGTVPARLDKGEPLNKDDYGVNDDMKHNLHPEVVGKLGGGVIVDLTRRLNLCFDSLGFAGKPAPAAQETKVVPQPEIVKEPTAKSPAQTAPAADNSFDLCFKRCRQYTDRTKDQCFDACNK